MNELPYSARFKAGDEVWIRPIRFWETTEPEHGTVVQDVESEDQSVYLHHDGYGHTVYVDRAKVFCKREAAIKSAELLTAYKMLVDRDSFDRMWQDIEAHLEERRAELKQTQEPTNE